MSKKHTKKTAALAKTFFLRKESGATTRQLMAEFGFKTSSYINSLVRRYKNGEFAEFQEDDISDLIINHCQNKKQKTKLGGKERIKIDVKVYCDETMSLDVPNDSTEKDIEYAIIKNITWEIARIRII